jgi:hypothetical protein
MGDSAVELYWLPLGAGGHSVRHNGRVYEAVVSRLERRRAFALYHSALVVRLPEGEFVVESAPVLDTDGAARGVAVDGPVGARMLGRFRLFRYEVRCWRGGVIPDVAEAVDSPRVLTREPAAARRVLGLVGELPAPVWGRDELGAGEMWNSNSVVSWLLVRAGIDLADAAPPQGGRAPGWDAGVVVARRSGARPVAKRDHDRREGDDRRDDVGDDDRPVVARDPVREPEQEAEEQHALIAG